MEMIDKLRERRAGLLERRKVHVSAAADATGVPIGVKLSREDLKREMTDAESERFDEAIIKVRDIDLEIDELDERLADLEKLDSRVRAVAGHKGLYPGSSGGLGGKASRAWEGLDTSMTSDTATGLRSRALDALDALREGLPESAGTKLGAMVSKDPSDQSARYVLATGDPAYLSAFEKLFRDPERGHLLFSQEELYAFQRANEYKRAAMAEGTGSAGGYMVPLQIDQNIIITNTGTTSAMRELARKVTTSGSAWAGISSAGVTATWKIEGNETGDASPTVSMPKIPVNFASCFVDWSYELADDSEIVSQIAAIFADAKLRIEEAAFVNGVGPSGVQPNGLVSALVAASKTITTATAATFAVADLYSMKSNLPQRYRKNAAWLANEDIYDLARQFATGTGPQSAFWVDLGGGVPPQLLGHQAAISDSLDDVPTTANKYIVAYGDFSNYVIVDRLGATIEFIPNLFGSNNRPTGQRGAYYWWRVGGDCVNTDAFRLLKVHA